MLVAVPQKTSRNRKEPKSFCGAILLFWGQAARRSSSTIVRRIRERLSWGVVIPFVRLVRPSGSLFACSRIGN